MDFTIGCVNYFLILHADICVFEPGGIFMTVNQAFLFLCALKEKGGYGSFLKPGSYRFLQTNSSIVFKTAPSLAGANKNNSYVCEFAAVHPQQWNGARDESTLKGWTCAIRNLPAHRGRAACKWYCKWSPLGEEREGWVGGAGLFAGNKAFPEESCLKLPRQMRRLAARHERNGLVSATFISLPGGDLLLCCCFCCSYLPRRA